jgi:dCTP diphosphatase
MIDAKSLPALQRLVADFIRQRDWEQFHSPKNLAMSISIEAAELMEIFQWLDAAQADRVGQDPELRARVEEEIADVFAYMLSLANRLDIDLGEALVKKMERNAVKYPADAFRGRSGAQEPGR